MQAVGHVPPGRSALDLSGFPAGRPRLPASSPRQPGQLLRLGSLRFGSFQRRQPAHVAAFAAEASGNNGRGRAASEPSSRGGIERGASKTEKAGEAGQISGQLGKAAQQDSSTEQVHQAAANACAPAPAAVWLPFRLGTAGAGASYVSVGVSPWRLPARRLRSARSLGRLLLAVVRLLGAARRAAADWLVYQLHHRVMEGGLGAKLLGYFLSGLPLTLVFGLAYSVLSGRPVGEGLVQAWGNLYKVPGTKVLGDVNVATTTLNNITWFCGTLSFGLLLGFITDNVQQRFQALRKGMLPVQASHHTVVLGYNRQLAPLLRQIAASQRERSAFHGPVVVLAEKEKEEMDRELGEALAHTHLDVTTRSGPPDSAFHLHKTRAAQADTVFLLAPDGSSKGGDEDSDTPAAERQVSALLALQALRAAHQAGAFSGSSGAAGTALGSLWGANSSGSSRRSRHEQLVVLQCPADTAAAPPPSRAGSHTTAAGSDASSGEEGTAFATAVPMSGHGLLDATRELLLRSRQRVEFADVSASAGLAGVMAASAVQPGVATVVCSLVQQNEGQDEGVELYIGDFPEFSGLSYGEARRRFSKAAAIGYLTSGVNPYARNTDIALEQERAGLDLVFGGTRWPRVHLSPSDTDELHVNQALVLLAHNQADASPSRSRQHSSRQVAHFAPTLQDAYIHSPYHPRHTAGSGGASGGSASGTGPAAGPHAAVHDSGSGGAGAEVGQESSKPRHVFILEWGAKGEGPPSEAVSRVVHHLQEQLPHDSMITVLGPCRPEADSGPHDGKEEGSEGVGPQPHRQRFEEALSNACAARGQQGSQASGQQADKEQDQQGSEKSGQRASQEGRAGAAQQQQHQEQQQHHQEGSDRKVVHLQHIPGPCGTVAALMQAGVPQGDAVVVLRSGALAGGSASGEGSGGAQADADSDAHVLAALVLLEACLARAGRSKAAPLHVLASVQRAGTIQAANHLLSVLGRGRMTAELLQPDEVAAGLLTQISAEPRLRHVLEALLGQQGTGAAAGGNLPPRSSAPSPPPISLQAPERYGISPAWGKVSFGHLAEHVRTQGDTAIGYIGKDGGFRLVPPALEERVWGRGDRLIVLKPCQPDT